MDWSADPTRPQRGLPSEPLNQPPLDNHLDKVEQPGKQREREKDPQDLQSQRVHQQTQSLGPKIGDKKLVDDSH